MTIETETGRDLGIQKSTIQHRNKHHHRQHFILLSYFDDCLRHQLAYGNFGSVHHS